MIELTTKQIQTALWLTQRLDSLEHAKKDAGAVEAYLCGNVSIPLPEDFVLKQLDEEIAQRKAELAALGIVLTT